MFYKISLLVLFASVVQAFTSSTFRLDLIENDKLNQVYAKSRELLTRDEKAFLEEILAADDIIMERQKRGIVDQILAAISGVSGGGFGLGSIVGPTGSPIVGTGQTAASDPARQTNNVANSAGQSVGSQAAQPSAPPTASNNDNHLFQQISKVIISSGTRNVTGIVDEALKIGTPAPVRELVNGIIAVSYCNGIRRLLGRC